MAQAQVSGPREKHNSWRRSTRQQVEDIVAEKEKPGAKRTRLEEELKDKNTYELAARRMGAPAQIRRMLGDTSYDYGTSLGKGAKATETEVSNKAFSEGKSLREMEPEVRKAMREAAAEERREARGMKKGGKVKSASSRADGCAMRGKTRGMMK